MVHTHDPKSQTALITGASVGIGLELARLFAADGYNLVLVARRADVLENVAHDLRTRGANQVHVCAQDLAEPAACSNIIDELANLKIDVDILVNNAGFGSNGPFAQADTTQQLNMLQVNITALTHLTRLFLPGMLHRGHGKIMNLASVAAFLPGPMMAVYFASKAYVLSFSLALAAECAGKGVSVTAVCPGPTKTEFQIRAGIENTKMFSGNTMTGEEVAKQAYHALHRGKPLLVNGMRNKLMTQMLRFAPRMAVAKLAQRVNSKR